MPRPPFDPSRARAARPAPPARTQGTLTVSQVNAMVKAAIETALPSTVHVVGQLSNLKRQSSGHLYFTLKDDASELACVMWRSSAEGLKFSPTDGLEAIATGQISVYERGGRYQLIARKIEPRGVGALELAFQQLCQKLSAEGLFDPTRKKPLPRFPRRIAVVTSPTGAAISDILRTLRRRFPCVDVVLFPVRVQGDGAAREIATALRSIDGKSEQLGGVDLIIVGRGGGSLEDLWAFNEEMVARAIFTCRIPIISAVGHETDVTVADLVADVRAATPTAAAEMAVPVLTEVLAVVDALNRRMIRALHAKWSVLQARMDGLAQRSSLADPMKMVMSREQILDDLANRCRKRLFDRDRSGRQQLTGFETIVQRIAPHTQLRTTSLRLRDVEHRLQWTTRRMLDRRVRAVDATLRSLRLAPLSARLIQLIDRTNELERELAKSVHYRLQWLQAAVTHGEQVLRAVSHESVLARGFSITRAKSSGKIVRSPQELKDRQRLVTTLATGDVESEVVNLCQLELFDES